MDFNEYQRKAKLTADYPNIYVDRIRELPAKLTNFDKLNFIYPCLGLAGETGEVIELIKKVVRDGIEVTPSFLLTLEKELGDVLWYLSTIATEFGLSLNTIAEENIIKLLDRKARGVVHGSGDNR